MIKKVEYGEPSIVWDTELQREIHIPRYRVTTYLSSNLCIPTNSGAKTRRRCPPSSCGKIQNISYPFRLTDDPASCGDRKYELSCENNVTVLNLFHGKFPVQEINYTDHTIRITDAGIQAANCSSVPRFYLSDSNFTILSGVGDNYGTDPISNDDHMFNKGIIFFSCSNPVSDPSYVDMDSGRPRCNGHPSRAAHVYALLFSSFWRLSLKDIRDGCAVQTVSLVVPQIRTKEYNVSLYYDDPDSSFVNVSEADIHALLVYGFKLSWYSAICEEKCGKWTQCFKNATSREIDYTSEEVECAKHYCHYAYHTTDQCGILPKGYRYTLGYLKGIVNGKILIISFLLPR
ncbi:hypothetical protein L6164_028556 [Bauhinia variegata]|uniref:Uncharacterized protein n=1 Tax=Bauhinia variegata TaxID=167791 RepID=A0ACB9L6B5_BAUVA|nr:hypothetical protein L6164_028556 [Bauhinia variegata]